MDPFFYRTPYSYYSPSNYTNMHYRNNRYYGNQRNKFNTDSNMKDENISVDYDSDKKKNNEEKDFRSKSSVVSPVFEIFGIKLYFDDILLISLIFFLYSEGVKDQSLFIALILLLLS